MSEERQLNEVEELLRSLVPAPPSIDRDALFFEAGLAAARRAAGGRRLIWPAIAASLLVVCCGLGLGYREKSAQLDALLAASAPSSVPQVAVAGNDTTLTEEETGAVLGDIPRFGLRSPSRDVERMFRLDATAGGRLTALGWVAGRAGAEPPKADRSIERAEFPERPIRRIDYWQLLDGHGG